MESVDCQDNQSIIDQVAAGSHIHDTIDKGTAWVTFSQSGSTLHVESFKKPRTHSTNAGGITAAFQARTCFVKGVTVRAASVMEDNLRAISGLEQVSRHLE